MGSKIYHPQPPRAEGEASPLVTVAEEVISYREQALKTADARWVLAYRAARASIPQDTTAAHDVCYAIALDTVQALADAGCFREEYPQR
jgi:hypothetical protein